MKPHCSVNNKLTKLLDLISIYYKLITMGTLRKVTLADGAGGRGTERLVKEVFLRYFGEGDPLLDSALLTVKEGSLAFTTDSFVVKPLFFPGGDIGSLSVSGTINDLAVVGAEPLFLSAGFVIEEGMEVELLERIAESMGRTAKESGVHIVAGDTKVVERGSCDGLFINTSGIGRIYRGFREDYSRIKPGDIVYINGPIGDHEAALLAVRGNLSFSNQVSSDCTPLWSLVRHLLDSGADIHFMRDPTRGGVATVLNEIADAAGVMITLDEKMLPIRDEVLGACEIFGFDPLYLANEGKIIFIVEREDRTIFEESLSSLPEGEGFAMIGEVGEGRGVYLRTRLGGMRRLLMLEGMQLPRIC